MPYDHIFIKFERKHAFDFDVENLSYGIFKKKFRYLKLQLILLLLRKK